MSNINKYRVQLKPSYRYSTSRSTEINHKSSKKIITQSLSMTSSNIISIESGGICTDNLGLNGSSDNNLGSISNGRRNDLLELNNISMKDIHNEYEVNNTPKLVLTPPTWVNNFRNVYSEDKHFAKHWFWDNFQWNKQSLWIGKFNKTNNLPDSDIQINDFLKRLIVDLNQKTELKSQMYIKFYFARNFKTKEPEINYLLICNQPKLPDIFLGTLVDITFERYQLTESIINRDSDFKKMINHYLNWSNFYIYYNLMEEMQY